LATLPIIAASSALLGFCIVSIESLEAIVISPKGASGMRSSKRCALGAVLSFSLTVEVDSHIAIGMKKIQLELYFR
jgi:hypothetical protein